MIGEFKGRWGEEGEDSKTLAKSKKSTCGAPRGQVATAAQSALVSPGRGPIETLSILLL